MCPLSASTPEICRSHAFVISTLLTGTFPVLRSGHSYAPSARSVPLLNSGFCFAKPSRDILSGNLSLAIFYSLITRQLSNSLLHSLRKEVIQPHLPIRLPCYDFTPVINPAFDGSFTRLGHRLRALSTPMV